MTSTNKTSLTFTLPTGLFKGSVTNANPKTISFNGVVLQKQNLGCGYFLGTNQSGRVQLRPSNPGSCPGLGSSLSVARLRAGDHRCAGSGNVGFWLLTAPDRSADILVGFGHL